MSSISLSLKMLLAASACAGLTLLACGEDSSGGGDDDDKAGEKDDDDKPKDAGKRTDAGKKDAGITIEMAVPGEDCDTSNIVTALGGGRCDEDACDEPPCAAKCVDGTWDECQPAKDLLGSIVDSGILNRDGGSVIPGLGDGSIKRTDGGTEFMVGDAKVVLPDQECVAPLECSTNSSNPLAGIISSLAMGLPFCADSTGLPPACTVDQDCKDLGINLPCLDTMVIGKFCLQTCK